MPRNGQTLKPLVKLGKDPAACWQWLGNTREHDGLALKQVAGRSTSARRWLSEILFGPIPDGIVVAQLCGNQSCINPHHTKRCLLSDALRAGATSTLTAGDARAIREAKGKVPAKKLADEHGVSAQTIRDIWRGDTWKVNTKSPTAKTPSSRLTPLQEASA